MKLRSLSIALWLFLAGTARATETVPFVGCAGDGQMGPIAAPRGVNKAFAIDRHAAAQLAFYQAAPFKGVLAPRGWHCFFWYGSNGETLIVAPTRRIEKLGFAKLSTPAVILTRSDGDTSGRFAVAQISARLFAQQEADYIQRVIDEGILAKEEFPFGPYPGDKLTYRSGRDVVFETPAHKEGIGTSGVLAPSVSPIAGRAILVGPSDAPDLWCLEVRLPRSTSHLTSTILETVELDAAEQ